MVSYILMYIGFSNSIKRAFKAQTKLRQKQQMQTTRKGSVYLSDSIHEESNGESGQKMLSSLKAENSYMVLGHSPSLFLDTSYVFRRNDSLSHIISGDENQEEKEEGDGENMVTDITKF